MKRFLYLALVLLMLNGCDSINDAIDSMGGSDDEEIANNTKNPDTTADTLVEAEPEPETETETETTISSSRFHHYNPDAYEMGRDSVSFVLCNGQRYSSCSLNGQAFTLHGLQDEHRDVWMLYGNKHISGEVICKSGDKSYSFKVSGYGGIQFGSCN